MNVQGGPVARGGRVRACRDCGRPSAQGRYCAPCKAARAAREEEPEVPWGTRTQAEPHVLLAGQVFRQAIADLINSNHQDQDSAALFLSGAGNWKAIHAFWCACLGIEPARAMDAIRALHGHRLRWVLFRLSEARRKARLGRRYRKAVAHV